MVHLGKTYAKQGDAAAIDALLKELRPLFGDMSKAKAAKLVRTLIDVVAQIPDSLDLQVRMCEESIAWTVEEKRTFLRHRLQASFLCVFLRFPDLIFYSQTKLAELYRVQKNYPPSIELINELIKEVPAAVSSCFLEPSTDLCVAVTLIR